MRGAMQAGTLGIIRLAYFQSSLLFLHAARSPSGLCLKVRMRTKAGVVLRAKRLQEEDTCAIHVSASNPPRPTKPAPFCPAFGAASAYRSMPSSPLEKPTEDAEILS